MKTVIDYIYSYLRRVDYMIWVPCFILSALSLFLIAGILDSEHAHTLRISNRNLVVQGVSALLGVFGAVIISLIDYRDLARLWKLYAPLCYALLMLTFFIGVGAVDRPDDRRWLLVPVLNITFQPAELLRVAFILMFAYHIYKVKDRLNHPLHLALLLAHGMVPVVIVYFQGDGGSALIFAAIMACMLFGAGLSWRYVAAAVVAAGISLPVMWNFVLGEFQRDRILQLYYRTDLLGVFYQQNQALTALAFGGSGGQGLFGVEADRVGVPEMHNDFIFAFLGESIGFVGTLLTILVMVVLWFKILRCAGKAKDMLGYMICMGVFAMLAFQAVINIGMNIAVLPVIGNTLPFLSYGGSSVLTSYLGIGLVLSVSMHSSKSMFDSQEE
ncbi:MAG: FtsW/RodA/SpoVE family cell cycle protein [Oscillospiraceae bacterium]|nr:FtsW/RodA/SpoVE family cell cycle protein [Oscillospiraceae bacterium]